MEPWRAEFLIKLHKFIIAVESHLDIDGARCYEILEKRLGEFYDFCITHENPPQVAYWISHGMFLSSEQFFNFLSDVQILSFDRYNTSLLNFESEDSISAIHPSKNLKTSVFLNLYSTVQLIQILEENNLTIYKTEIQEILANCKYLDDFFRVAPILELCYYTKANYPFFETLFDTLNGITLSKCPVPKTFFILTFVTACTYYIRIDRRLREIYPIADSFFITLWMMLFHQIIIVSTPSWGSSRRVNPPCLILHPSIENPREMYTIMQQLIRDRVGLGANIYGQSISSSKYLRDVILECEENMRAGKKAKLRVSGMTYSVPTWDINFYIMLERLETSDRFVSIQVNGICDPEIITILNEEKDAPKDYFILLPEKAVPSELLDLFYNQNAQEALANAFAKFNAPDHIMMGQIRDAALPIIKDGEIRLFPPHGFVARVNAEMIKLHIFQAHKKASYIYHSSQKNMVNHGKIYQLPTTSLNLCMEIISPTLDGDCNLCSIGNINMTFLSIPFLLRRVKNPNKLFAITRFAEDILCIALQYCRYRSSSKIQKYFKPAFLFPCQGMTFLGFGQFTQMNLLHADDSREIANDFCNSVKLQASMAGRYTHELEILAQKHYFRYLEEELPLFAETIRTEIGETTPVCVRTAIPPSARNAVFARHPLEATGVNMYLYRRALSTNLYDKNTLLPTYLMSKLLIEETPPTRLQEALKACTQALLTRNTEGPNEKNFIEDLTIKEQLDLYASQLGWVTQSMSVSFHRAHENGLLATIQKILAGGEERGLITLLYYLNNSPMSRDNLFTQ